MKTNKFNIHWQLVRLEAKGIKNPRDKLNHVLKFLDDNPNQHNYNRVINWVLMTSYGYRYLPLYENAYRGLLKNKYKYSDPNDMDNDITKVDVSKLKALMNDLFGRKYNFQYDKTPEDHKDFVNYIMEELERRKNG